MMEDKSVITFVGRISNITRGIRSQEGTKEDDEVICNILKTLTPPFKLVV